MYLLSLGSVPRKTVQKGLAAIFWFLKKEDIIFDTD